MTGLKLHSAGKDMIQLARRVGDFSSRFAAWSCDFCQKLCVAVVCQHLAVQLQLLLQLTRVFLKIRVRGECSAKHIPATDSTVQ